MPEEKQQPIKLKYWGIRGVIRQTEVTDDLIPEGGVVEAINVHFDKRGAITLRPGIAILGNQVQANQSCNGLFNALFSNTGSNALLVVFSNGSSNFVSRLVSSSFNVSLAGLSDTAKIRLVMLGDRALMANGPASMRAYVGGDTWISTGSPMNPDKAPPGKYLERFKGKIYVSGDPNNPDRLYFSDVITSTGNINWVNATNFVDIEPNDGENLTGLKRYSLELLNFKPNYLYRFKTSGLDPEPLIKIGTRSQESIIEGKMGLYFHHDSGFYRYSGGYPIEISRPISDIITAIPYAYYDDVSSWKDSDHIYWSVGDLTIEGQSWVNVVCRYTESSELWTIYSYGTEIKWGADYNSGSALSQVVADNNGKVYTFNSGLTDNGTAISYRIISKWYDFGNLLATKTIQQMVASCEKAQGSRLMYQINDETNWQEIGQITKFLTNFDSLAIKFNQIRFKIIGMSSVEAFVFLGLEIDKIISQNLIVKE